MLVGVVESVGDGDEHPDESSIAEKPNENIEKKNRLFDII